MTPQQIEAMKMALEALEYALNKPMWNRPKMTVAITALEEALAEHAMQEVQRLGQEIEQKPVAWLLTDKNINSIQVDSIQRLIDRLKHAHHTDIRVRINGHDEWFEADWLKHMVRVTPPQPEQNPMSDEMLQAITDPENQPSQYGTVTLDYHFEKIKKWEDLFERMSNKVLQQLEQEPVISKWVLREVYFDEDGEPIMHRSPPQPEQEPVPNRLFLEKMLAAMEGVIDVADRKTDEFEALRRCVVDLTLMLHSTPQRTWVDVPDEEIKILWIQYRAALPRYLCFAKDLLSIAKEKNT